MKSICLAVLVTASLFSASAMAECRNTQAFPQWLKHFKQEAIQSGLKPDLVNNSLKGVKYDAKVIKNDRSQKVFAQSFLQFAGKKVSNYRLAIGRKKLKQNRRLFQRIEKQFGVPAEVLTAFWALETDFGAVTGNYSTLSSLATLAYDCRRPELFRPELIHALWLIQKGDTTPATMKGAWAGELGQLQFLPQGYNLHAVDYDGDGKRNLIKSSADALASAASLLKHYNWQANQPWLVEVKVPKKMDWIEASLTNKKPMSYWQQQGVKLRNGQALKHNYPAALLLPMGRNGPAFLAFANFDVFLKWNQSVVYSTTSAYLATRFAGAKTMRNGNATVKPLTVNQVKTLQSKLKARGFDVGKIDGIIGSMTRAAVRTVQQRFKLPADGYPDANLLAKL